MLAIQIIMLQVVVFGAVIFFLKRILYRDTESSINRLDRVYQDLLSKQKELTEKIEAAEKEYNQKKEEAATVIIKLKTEAMDEARQKQDELIKKAKTQAEDLVKKAHESTENYQKEIEKKLRRELIDEAGRLLNSAFSPQITSVLHNELMKEFLERAQTFDLSSVGAHINTLTIKSPVALKKEERAQLDSFIQAKLKRPIQIEEVVDKNLIAGVLLQFGTLLLDGSLLNYVRDASEIAKKNLEHHA